VFAVVEVRHPQFGEEKHGQDQVDGGEHHLVDHGFDLRGRVFPRPFNRPCHIAGGIGIGGHAEYACQDKDKAKDKQKLLGFFHGFSTSPFMLLLLKKNRKAAFALRSVLFLMIFLRLDRRE